MWGGGGGEDLTPVVADEGRLQITPPSFTTRMHEGGDPRGGGTGPERGVRGAVLLLADDGRLGVTPPPFTAMEGVEE